MEAGTVVAMVVAAMASAAAVVAGITLAAAAGVILADIAAVSRAIRSGEHISAAHISAEDGLRRVPGISVPCGMPRSRLAMPVMQ